MDELLEYRNIKWINMIHSNLTCEHPLHPIELGNTLKFTLYNVSEHGWQYCNNNILGHLEEGSTDCMIITSSFF